MSLVYFISIFFVNMFHIQCFCNLVDLLNIKINSNSSQPSTEILQSQNTSSFEPPYSTCDPRIMSTVLYRPSLCFVVVT
jgi:hypothetical protein